VNKEYPERVIRDGSGKIDAQAKTNAYQAADFRA
jgi:hypothetical protein